MVLTPFGLLRPLSLTLPTDEETTFLRACLQAGGAGRQAWRNARALVVARLREPRHAAATPRRMPKSLLPLLLVALRRQGATLDETVQTVLRTAYVAEEARSTTYRRIARDVLTALTSAGIPVVVLKGAALAETVYPEPALRHCHDLDLLVRRSDLAGATRACAALGLRPANGVESGTEHARLDHATGLPVELHSRLFRVPYYEAGFDQVWDRTRSGVIAGVPTRILSPEDNLLHVCGHASYCRSRETLRWVCDAWFIVGRQADLDWDDLLERARRWRLTVPLAVALHYLATELAAPIPMAVVAGLLAAAAGADAIERQAALFGARAAPRWTVGGALRDCRDWRTRLFVLRWLALPSPRYLRLVEAARYSWLPLAYLQRPARYVARRLERLAPPGVGRAYPPGTR